MGPGIVYLYDALTHQTVYVNRQVTQLLGYAPDQLVGTPGPFQPLLHPEDTGQFTEQQQHLATAADGVRIEAVYRVRHANGSYRWLQSRETVFRRTAEGHPAQIFGVAQDVTAQQRLQDRVQQRQIQREAIPQRLRAFRERLGVTQAEFGQRFGQYHPRQIGNYETGVADPPLDLLLAIQNQGYPLTAILGENPDTLLEETLGHLTSRYSEFVIAQQLAETQRRLAEREGNKVAQMLRALGLDPHPLTTPQRELLERLANLVSPDPTTSTHPPHVLTVTTARKRRARRLHNTPPPAGR